MVAALEDRFPVVTSVKGPVDGVIVLGGSVDQYLSQYRKQVVLNNGGERMTGFVALARQYPNAKLIFTGGSGRLEQKYKEADTARAFFYVIRTSSITYFFRRPIEKYIRKWRFFSSSR